MSAQVDSATKTAANSSYQAKSEAIDVTKDDSCDIYLSHRSRIYTKTSSRKRFVSRKDVKSDDFHRELRNIMVGMVAAIPLDFSEAQFSEKDF